jgi:tetratricopeptide (TPR) repeat protein
MFAMAVLPGVALSNEKAGDVISRYGDVWISTDSDDNWQRIESQQSLNVGNVIRTGRLSGVSLRMQDESLIRLAQNSQFQIEGIQITSFWRQATAQVNKLNRSVKSAFRLISGQMWGRNNNRNVNTQVSTLTATIGIRGTEYSIQAEPSFSLVTTQEGQVEVTNEYGQTIISSGESARIRAGAAPQKTRLVQTDDAVQWTLNIPDLINFSHYLKMAFQNKQLGLEVYEAYQKTYFARANDLITSELQRQPDNLDLKLLQAWILIKSGEIRSTYAKLLSLAEQNPDHVATLELTALTALLNGDANATRTLIETIDSNRLSDGGWVIRGYAAQTDFNLPAASEAYLNALRINPNNLVARIQLAKIYFGSDQRELAQVQINRALQHQQDYPPALNLQGFLQLAQNDTPSAIVTWQGILGKYPPDAETHFGLSLAFMRQREVQRAMQHIATAVLLDPQRSMYLSYWGKMLHQIGRYQKALTVLDSAIRLDNQDPTPHLYKAIILRDLNKPGEAIEHIHTALELNDNRGVYRSRSLLDKDLAVQNVDLSRLYNQLGLANWAHKKAIASIKSDFTNPSAHIINAGAYAALGDRSYALANEALLARILQPANINAVSSFNGYTSLYEAPETEFDVVLGAGNHAQRSITLTGAGALPQKQAAWAFAALHDETDGWRDTNGENVTNLSVIGKWQPDLKNNLLFSLSVSQFEQQDDLVPRFEIDSTTDPLANFELDTQQIELGLHHHINYQHDLLVYVSHLNSDGVIRDNVVDNILTSAINGAFLGTQERIIDSDFERPHTLFQVQGIKKHNDHQFIYGILALEGKFDARTRSDFGVFDSTQTLTDPLLTFDSLTSYNLDISLLSLYLQDSWHLSPSLQLDIAAYFEQMDNANALTGGEWEINETTGRLGLIWKMNERHTFRFATFEYLLPLTIARLDPTDIAGVPIFKNTNEGSLVTESDLVWDFEWDSGLLSTTLFTLEESFTSATPDTAGAQVKTIQKGEKEGVTINLSQLLNRKTGLSVELNHFDVDDQSLPAANRTETALSLTATYVVGNGISVSARQIRRDMDFDSTRKDETIDVTNIQLAYEFPGKKHQLLFQVSNLADNKFNWVTDEFSTSGIAPERLFSLSYRASF